jgi:Brp/Blh family beta-carotene 15,15'-monooxygenase
MGLRSQGLAFCAVAWLSLVACLWLPLFDTQAQLVLISPVILLLGVPHGALDVIYVQQIVGVRSVSGWCLFILCYLTITAAVVAVWWFAPGFFLAAFLVVSAFHFSGDPEGLTPTWFRVLYGGAVIFCPLALHAAEVLQTFSLLAGESASQAIVTVLQWAAWPWLVGIGVATIGGAKSDRQRSIELLSVTAVLTLAPPLIGFTIFFCCMHSARHVLRTRDYSRAGTLGHLLQVAALPMLTTVAGIFVLWRFSDGKPIDLRLAQILFVGLAALTVPHMIVMERVRLTGWALGRALSR